MDNNHIEFNLSSIDKDTKLKMLKSIYKDIDSIIINQSTPEYNNAALLSIKENNSIRFIKIGNDFIAYKLSFNAHQEIINKISSNNYWKAIHSLESAINLLYNIVFLDYQDKTDNIAIHRALNLVLMVYRAFIEKQ